MSAGMRWRQRGRRIRGAVLAAVWAGAAAAAEVKVPQGWTVDLSAEIRLRGEARNNADLDSAQDDDRREGLLRTRLGLSIEKKGEVRMFFQAQDSRLAGQEASTASNERNLDLHQGYLELRATGGSGLVLYAGRREWKYGDERLVGAFGWDNVGRAFDGATLRWEREKFWLDGFYAQVDQELDDSGRTRGDSLFGAYAQWVPRSSDEWEAYGMIFRDSEQADGEAGTEGTTRVEMLGARGRSRVARFDYLVEAAVQRGRFNGNEHRAWAAAAQAGLALGSRRIWRAFAGYDFATGDRSNADRRHGEFFNFFPTNHPHYGYMDLLGWRNLSSPYLGLSLSTGRHWVQARLHRFDLEAAGGRWSSAGEVELGFDESGQSGRRVGREVDLTYRLRWNDRLALEADLSRFEPGEFAEAATPGEDPSHFGYVMLTFSL